MPPKKGKPPVKTPAEEAEEARLLQEEEEAISNYTYLSSNFILIIFYNIGLQEEAEAEEIRLAELQRKLEENISSVYFTKAKVKYICSPHSGSILANDGPIVSLNNIIFIFI
jgi:hypothetical protein